jgi:hypothetical protein
MTRRRSEARNEGCAVRREFRALLRQRLPDEFPLTFAFPTACFVPKTSGGFVWEVV